MDTEAWVLYRGERPHGQPGTDAAELVHETFPIPDLGEHDVLAEPIYGCWEGNMTHALRRDPVDVCRFRREKKIVLGNAGVVRVLQTGAAVDDLSEGQACIVFGNAEPDGAGYMVKALAFDARKTMGVLAKRTRLHRRNLIPVPDNSRHSLKRWAAFSLRYITAWSNWKLAYGSFRLQMNEVDCPAPYVAAWGGGVSLGQLALARLHGCKTAMIASREERLALLRSLSITPIDRREFAELSYDPDRYRDDTEYRKRYNQAEKLFLQRVSEAGGGQPVAIFFDHIGAPVYRATLAALGRQGVIASAGWKHGGTLGELQRITECIRRHIHVNTHYARYSEGVAATAFAENTGWLPPVDDDRVYDWSEIPTLVQDYDEGRMITYFPLFQVNPE